MVRQAVSEAAICRTPPGVRGLKPEQLKGLSLSNSRTPPGVRGLKP